MLTFSGLSTAPHTANHSLLVDAPLLSPALPPPSPPTALATPSQVPLCIPLHTSGPVLNLLFFSFYAFSLGNFDNCHSYPDELELFTSNLSHSLEFQASIANPPEISLQRLS